MNLDYLLALARNSNWSSVKINLALKCKDNKGQILTH